MASPPNVFFSIFAVPNFQIMNKIELYEQCKVALHVLNTRPLDLDEYPEAVNAMLRKMGARDVKDGLLRSPGETRSSCRASGEACRDSCERGFNSKHNIDIVIAIRLAPIEMFDTMSMRS